MAKDINIHVKTAGTGRSKEQLDSVGRSAKTTGDKIEKTGSRTSRAAGKIADGFAKIAGPLGIVALVTALTTAAVKVAKFFDNLKTKIDEAVETATQLRKAYEDIFEAMSAFDEKSRQQVTKQSLGLLQKTGVSEQVGLPIINAYTRQFKGLVESGQLTQGQYTQGLEGMLGYGARHGGAATPELIQLMAGWGMTTPEQQGGFRRMIAMSAGKVGLTDTDVIDALAKGMSTIKAMGWTPEQAIETIAVLAAGEAGRKKKSLPATTIQALGAPVMSEEIAKEYGISPAEAEDPQKLFDRVRMMRETMSTKAYYRMLIKIYSTEGAAGVTKLAGADRGPIRAVLREAVGEFGIAAEQKEELQRQTTLEAEEARGDAIVKQEQLKITRGQRYGKEVREVGAEKQKLLYRESRRGYLRQWMLDFFTLGDELEKEYAARRKWADELSEEEKQELIEQYKKPLMTDYDALRAAWKEMSAEEQFRELSRPQQGPGASNSISYHYHTGPVHYPRVGLEDGPGPRVDNDIQ